MTCIRMVDFNICLYKTKVLSTIELLGDNWRIVVMSIFLSISLWAQVVVLDIYAWRIVGMFL